jgi:hypothetical protein
MNHKVERKQQGHGKLQAEEKVERPSVKMIPPVKSDHIPPKIPAPIDRYKKTGEEIKTENNLLGSWRDSLGSGKTQGKVKEGRWNEEQTDPKNIPPQESEIGIGGGEEDGPFNVPRGNAYKHDGEGAVDWIAPLPGIDKNANEKISDCGDNGGEGMNIQFIHPSRRRGGDGFHSCSFC